MPNSYFILSVLALIAITWVLGTACFLDIKNQDIKKGWRGFIECVGWAGFAAMFLSLFLIGAGAMMNRPLRDGEFLAVALIELAVFAMSTVCTFIPDWFPASNEVGSEEQEEA